MAATLTLVNPLSADDAQRIGLAARAYSIGEVVTVEDWAGSTLVRTGYAVAGAAFPNTLLTGTGPPDAGIGANGSYYLDTAAQRLYGPKTGGAWPVALNPGRGIASATISGGRLILTYSDGASVDLGNVQGPSGTGTTDSRLDGLTSLATPNVVVLRDNAGRFRAVAPAVAQDVANKDYTDTADLTFRRLLVVPVTTSRALQLDDEGDQLVVDSTSNLTVTVPPNSSVAFPIGAWVEVVRANTGTVTISPGSGVTVVAPDSGFTLRARYSVVRLRKTATDTWYLEGDAPSTTDAAVSVASSAATPSVLVRRDASAQSEFNQVFLNQTGTAANTATRKDYVDGRDALLIPLTQRGAALGVATLDSAGVIPSAQLPPLAITDTFVVASQAAMLALTAQVGDVAVRTDGTGSWILRLSDPSALASWQQLTAPTNTVTSVDGQTGAVALGDVSASASSLARRGTGGTLLAAAATLSTELTTLGQQTSAIAASRTATVTEARQEPLSRSVSAAITLALVDAGDLVNVANTVLTSLVQVTIPLNSAVAFPVGSWVDVCSTSVGTVLVAGASGVTLRGDGRVYGNYGSARLVKIGTDEWVVTSRSIPAGAFARCFAYMDSNVVGWGAGWKHMPLNAELVDTHGGHVTGGITGEDTDTTAAKQTNRFTVPPGQYGNYKFSGMVNITVGTTSTIHSRFLKNGAFFRGCSGMVMSTTASGVSLTGEKLLPLADGEYIGLQGYCNNGNWNSESGETSSGGATSWMSVERID